jgi:fatty-acyl-CoA synthase
LPGARGVAVFPVPDSRTGDQVMAAIEFAPDRSFDPVAFVAFLGRQADLGTKWAPRYVRIMAALPVTATDKVDKLPLRAEMWNVSDPVWRRRSRSQVYEVMTRNDLDGLRDEFAANGRLDLLTF